MSDVRGTTVLDQLGSTTTCVYRILRVVVVIDLRQRSVMFARGSLATPTSQ